MAAPQEEMTEHEAFLKRMEQAGAGKLKPRKRDRLSADARAKADAARLVACSAPVQGLRKARSLAQPAARE